MPDSFSLLTANWFLDGAAFGVAVGYALRIIEHFVWALKARDQTLRDVLLFALMVLPQSVLFGTALGYVIVVVVAYNVRNETVLGLSVYAVSAVLAFIAIDLRDLLRRISKW